MITYGVLTACLNSATTIGRTINSVIKQSVQPTEYIFVDGGSTDQTLATVREGISRMDDSVRCEIIHQKGNLGIYDAWNQGLELMQADIIFILSSDDWYPDSAASDILRIFSDFPDTSVVCGSGRYFHPEGLHPPVVCQCRGWWTHPFAMPIIHPACFIRRSVYQQIGVFDSSFKVSGDYEFILRCRKHLVNFVMTDKVLVNVTTGGYSERNKATARRETFRAAHIHSRWTPVAVVALLARFILGR